MSLLTIFFIICFILIIYGLDHMITEIKLYQQEQKYRRERQNRIEEAVEAAFDSEEN